MNPKHCRKLLAKLKDNRSRYDSQADYLSRCIISFLAREICYPGSPANDLDYFIKTVKEFIDIADPDGKSPKVS